MRATPKYILIIGSLCLLAPLAARAQSSAAGSTVAEPVAVAYAYDAAGRLVEALYGDTLRVTYAYDAAGNVTATSGERVVTVEGGPEVPRRFALGANYPNPFNPETVIRYDVPKRAHVHLAVYDVLGRPVRMLLSAEQAAGYHELSWDGRTDAGQTAATGIYLYRLEAAGFSSTRKMLLLR